VQNKIFLENNIT